MGNSSCPVPLLLPIDPTPFLSNGNINFKAHDVGWIVSGALALIAITTSFWLINKHLSFFYAPSLQRHIVRILFMVPIYSVTSFLSYFFYNEALYFQLVRDCYEAFVISSFFHLLLSYLSCPEPTEEEPSPPPSINKSERHRRLKEVFKDVKVGKWMFPLGAVKWRPAGGGKGEGEAFLWYMRIGIGQYVIIRPLSTLTSVISEVLGVYCITSWSPKFLHLYMTVLVSISVSIAMYCVLQLYMPLKEQLSPYSPVMKFLSVKSVVFLTFWQETMLGVLVLAKVIKNHEYWSAAEIVIGLSAILSCFEMMIFGFVHIKAFTYLPYRALASPLPPPDPESSPRHSISSFEHEPRMDYATWSRREKEVNSNKKAALKLQALPKPSKTSGTTGQTPRKPDGAPVLRRTKRLWALWRVINISDMFVELKEEGTFVVRGRKQGKHELGVAREDDLELAMGRKREDWKMDERDDEEGWSGRRLLEKDEKERIYLGLPGGANKLGLTEDIGRRGDLRYAEALGYDTAPQSLPSDIAYPPDRHSTFQQIPRQPVSALFNSQQHSYQPTKACYRNSTPNNHDLPRETLPSHRPFEPSIPRPLSQVVHPRPPPQKATIVLPHRKSTPNFDIPTFNEPHPPPHRLSNSPSLIAPPTLPPPKQATRSSWGPSIGVSQIQRDNRDRRSDPIVHHHFAGDEGMIRQARLRGERQGIDKSRGERDGHRTHNETEERTVLRDIRRREDEELGERGAGSQFVFEQY